MRSVALVVVLILAAAMLLHLWYYLFAPFRTPEPEIVADAIESDPECVELLRRVARREPATNDAIQRNEKPVGLKCSNTDIVRAMRSEGAWVKSADRDGRRIDFNIKSRDRFLLAKRSRFGTYEKDLLFVVRTDDGTITHVRWAFPYIT